MLQNLGMAFFLGGGGGHPFVSRVLCAPGSIRPCRKVMIKGFYVWVLSEILAVICSNVTALMTPRLCSKIRDNGNQKSKDDIVSMKQDNVFYSSQSQQHLIHISSWMCKNSSRKILQNENDLRHWYRPTSPQKKTKEITRRPTARSLLKIITQLPVKQIKRKKITIFSANIDPIQYIILEWHQTLSLCVDLCSSLRCKKANVRCSTTRSVLQRNVQACIRPTMMNH